MKDQFKREERVREVDTDRKPRRGVFSHIGSNGLAQVWWDGRKHPDYIAVSRIERDEPEASNTSAEG